MTNRKYDELSDGEKKSADIIITNLEKAEKEGKTFIELKFSDFPLSIIEWFKENYKTYTWEYNSDFPLSISGNDRIYIF